MIRLFTKNATGVAPDGKWYAGDINALQDVVAALTDLTQTIALGIVEIGEVGLQLLRYGAGEARLTGALRTDGIIRALGGLYAGAFTTAARDAIAVGLRPYGLVILNTTTNQYEWNKGTDAVPNWQPINDNTAIAEANVTGLVADLAAKIAATIGTAKGDLIGFTAANTPARVAVGADNTVLTADSTAAAGVSYKAAAGTNYARVVALS